MEPGVSEISIGGPPASCTAFQGSVSSTCSVPSSAQRKPMVRPASEELVSDMWRGLLDRSGGDGRRDTLGGYGAALPSTTRPDPRTLRRETPGGAAAPGPGAGPRREASPAGLPARTTQRRPAGPP